MWHNCATKRLIFCQFYNINKLVTILSESSTYLTAAFTIPARYSHSVYEPSDTADPQLHLDPHIISEVLLKELKTTPIPVQISDILTSLKTGQIDTVFSPPYALLAMQWAPSVSYATDFIITFMVGSVMVDVKMFESMPKEYQDVMEKLFREKIDALKYNVRRDNAAAQEVLRKSGIKFVEVPQDQAKAFYEVGEKTSEYLIEKYGFSNELYQEIKTLMTDYRKNKK
jgi:TRAP-type C4-dicarboxylate transport system substrate-binding protein